MATLPITSLLTGSSVPFLASGDLLVFVDISDLTQSVNGSTVKATVDEFFNRLPVTKMSIVSTSVEAFAVGRQGFTNPAFVVDASAATSVTGLKVTAAAAAGGVAVVVQSSGTNESLTINSKGTGSITFQGTGTGSVGFGTDFGATQVVNAGFAGNVITANFALGKTQYHATTLSANASIVIQNNTSGRGYTLMVVDPGGYTLTMTTTVNWLGSALPATAFTAGKPVVLTFLSVGTTLYGQWSQVV